MLRLKARSGTHKSITGVVLLWLASAADATAAGLEEGTTEARYQSSILEIPASIVTTKAQWHTNSAYLRVRRVT